LIGNHIPDTNALATVAQFQFVDLLIEVVQETFVLAIFFFVGKGLQSNEGPGSPIRTSLTVILTVSIVLAAVLFSFSSSFVNVIGTPEAIRNTTAAFLQIKMAGVPIFLLSAAAIVIVETANRKKMDRGEGLEDLSQGWRLVGSG
jgi:Na+-driven multidrug efflux pump